MTPSPLLQAHQFVLEHVNVAPIVVALVSGHGTPTLAVPLASFNVQAKARGSKSSRSGRVMLQCGKWGRVTWRTPKDIRSQSYGDDESCWADQGHNRGLDKITSTNSLQPSKFYNSFQLVGPRSCLKTPKFNQILKSSFFFRVRGFIACFHETGLVLKTPISTPDSILLPIPTSIPSSPIL